MWKYPDNGQQQRQINRLWIQQVSLNFFVFGDVHKSRGWRKSDNLGQGREGDIEDDGRQMFRKNCLYLISNAIRFVVMLKNAVHTIETESV